MKVVVLGAGVIGVTTAYYLAKAGHKVIVVDRQGAAGMETSFANAGMISTGYSTPWAAPGVPIKAIKWMFQRLAPFKVSPGALNRHSMPWLIQMTRNCSHSAYATNKQRLLTLAEYSRESFLKLEDDLNIAYDNRKHGTLQLFRNKKQLHSIRQDLDVLDDMGIPYELLDAEGCLAVEPGLAHGSRNFVGGLRLINDLTGDCHLFTQTLVDECRKMGVEFRFDTVIDSIKATTRNIMYVCTGSRVIKGDAYVCALGSYSPELLKPLGVKLPIYPIKGYSLTYSISDQENHAPRSTIMDESYKVAITRFDKRIRVGGMAEIAAFNLKAYKKRQKALEFVLNDLFPGSVGLDEPEAWAGLRPMTPDSTPILGRTRYSNLYLNTGHGSLGWTLSLGSARTLAAIISELRPDVSPEDYSIVRYSNG
ncbi:D-amino acid dehydrogenase [Saccharospirillum salsuginis]|uniref:D-amino acid dehydrogenase n=1 Tax=Saccharospirillum salsuginis TaxID=418750 RepID=A0A918K114_9GAMM|nr:D-amino acid dehydrogenase [Saccharospirillum salsuginis]GGX41858.1 D-amino acid dehydrogenase [Saccharospirillum salsuginis]